MEEIRQDSRVMQSAPNDHHLRMIFNNLTGRNFKSWFAYRKHLRFACDEGGYKPGPIEFWRDGELIEKGNIASF